MKILIGIPTYDGKIDVRLTSFLTEGYKGRNDIVIEPVIHQLTDIARNKLVNIALQTKRHLIMVDADSIPYPNTFRVIASKISKEVCGVGVPYVSASGGICVGNRGRNLKDVENKTGWEAVDNFGTHCCGYSYDALQHLKFEYVYNDNRTGLVEGAEDSWANRNLYSKGIPLYVHWSYWASHVCNIVKGKPSSVRRQDILFMLENCNLD